METTVDRGELAALIEAALAGVTTGFGEVELRLVVKAGEVVQQTTTVVVSKKGVDSVRRPK